MVDLAMGFLDFARNNKEMYGTHHCNSLRKTDIGRQVVLAGWVNVTRDHGGVIFIDLRDREGLTQVVFRPEENAQLAKQAHTLRSEDVIQVSGRVAARPAGTENPTSPRAKSKSFRAS